jgi:NAD+ diphosphatase
MSTSHLQALFCLKCGAKLQEAVTDEGVTRRCCPQPAAQCGYIFYNNPVPVVAAIVEVFEPGQDAETEDGVVVLVRSHGWPENMYGLVTGFLEKGESCRAAVVREVKEELGLDCHVVKAYGVYDFQRFNQIIIAYHVRVQLQRPTRKKEGGVAVVVGGGGAGGSSSSSSSSNGSSNQELVLDTRELAGYKRVAVDQLRPWPHGTGLAVQDFLVDRMRERKAREAQQQQQSRL